MDLFALILSKKYINSAITAQVTDARIRTAFETMTDAAAGDLFYLDADGDLTRLPIGTVGQTLKVSSAGIPEWVT